jgi:hypothetical protein
MLSALKKNPKPPKNSKEEVDWYIHTILKIYKAYNWKSNCTKEVTKLSLPRKRHTRKNFSLQSNLPLRWQSLRTDDDQGLPPLSCYSQLSVSYLKTSGISLEQGAHACNLNYLGG